MKAHKSAILILLLIMLFVSVGYYCGYKRGTSTVSALEHSKRDTFMDTIPFYYPIPKESTVVRYKVVRFPAVNNGHESITTEKIYDSVSVIMPIERKVYHKDSCYTAWVSGYNPKLDSIKVFPKIIHTNHIMYKPPSRWGISLTAGYGYVPGSGFKPYLGVGISYTLMPFKWK